MGKKLALTVMSVVGMVVGWVAQRVVGPPVVALWGADMQRWFNERLLAVDALTWETWRWVLAGAVAVYALVAARLLVGQVKKRGPERVSGVILLANLPGLLVAVHVVGAVAVLAAVFGVL